MFLIMHFVPGAITCTFGTFHEAVFVEVSSRVAIIECACIQDKLLRHSIKNGYYPEGVGSIP